MAYAKNEVQREAEIFILMPAGRAAAISWSVGLSSSNRVEIRVGACQRGFDGQVEMTDPGKIGFVRRAGNGQAVTGHEAIGTGGKAVHRDIAQRFVGMEWRRAD